MLQHSQMLQQTSFPWYIDFANYLMSGLLTLYLSYQQKKKFIHDVKSDQWDEPYFYNKCSDHVIRRCVLEEEISDILQSCHAVAYGGYFRWHKTTIKVLQSGYYWTSIFKDAYAFVKCCDRCQRGGNISQKHEMPLTNILEVELFYVRRDRFYGTIPTLFQQPIHSSGCRPCLQMGGSYIITN